MLAAAMTNGGPINTGGSAPMQNPRNAPGWKEANRASAQQRRAAMTPSQLQASQQWSIANQQQVAARQAMNAQQQVFAPSSQALSPAWTGGSAQNLPAPPMNAAPQAQQAMAAQQSQLGYAAPNLNPYGMTMGGGTFDWRGSAASPLGQYLSQIQAPYTSQPMTYGGSSVPVSAYMF